ncbi:MAG: pyridoxamine 5'-phosphate oxidase family protein [Actinomycetota bacterium]|nr:pyridoxamine 5'-phosphate oxidase family protein [Acidimicrobiia bacterium]MDQ3145500.1 pyridoxamine 5'-phosphate oxidase family protein [Actinomycetota bacterium]
MFTWRQFADDAPELAQAGRSLLYQFGTVGLGFLATVRKDGGPRVHPMCPLLTEESLLAFIEPGPKRHDLHRDGRYALHCFPPEANEDAVYFTGQAVVVTDDAILGAATARWLAERRLDDVPPGFVQEELFELVIDRCLLTRTVGHGDWAPRHTVWHAGP